MSIVSQAINIDSARQALDMLQVIKLALSDPKGMQTAIDALTKAVSVTEDQAVKVQEAAKTIVEAQQTKNDLDIAKKNHDKYIAETSKMLADKQKTIDSSATDMAAVKENFEHYKAEEIVKLENSKKVNEDIKTSLNNMTVSLTARENAVSIKDTAATDRMNQAIAKEQDNILREAAIKDKEDKFRQIIG